MGRKHQWDNVGGLMRFIEKLLRFSLRNALILTLLTLLWTALAIWCYFSLPISLLPNLNFPTLSIIVEDQGLTAKELESQVAVPVESAMAGIYNVSRIQSTSVANLSLVTVRLKWGADLNLARQQVQQKLATVQGSLPTGSVVSIETLANTLGEVQDYALTGGASLDALHDFAEYQLKPQILQQSGVFDVLIFGGLVQEYSVFVNPSSLEEFGLTLKDVKDALTRNNVASVGGILDLGAQSFAIVPNTQLTGLHSIESAVIAVHNNVPVRIRDIGRVALSHLPVRGGAEKGTVPSVVVQVIKQPNADTVAVSHEIDQFMKTFKKAFPQGVSYSKFYDQAELVADSIHGVEEAVLLGAGLVGLILLVFLRSWRASLVAFTSIPTSLLSALIFMRLFGMTLNIMTLSALAIATGMVIDDAIVVIENFFRHRSLAPEAPVGEVFVLAASEVAGPVASSTITTVAIFAPLVFLSGLAGGLFSPVGVVVSIVMIASLVFALTLIPSLGPHLLRGQSSHAASGSMGIVSRGYERLLDQALRWRTLVILVVLVLLGGSFFLLTRLNREFLPLLDEGSILMTMDTPPGTSLGETERVIRLLKRNVFHDPDVASVVSTVGHRPGAQDTDTMNHSDIVAKLVPRSQRKKSIQDLFALFRKRSENYPGISTDLTMPLQDKLNDAVGGVPATVGVKIYGEDLDKLQALADQLAAGMAKIPGVVDLRPSSIVPVPSLEVSLIPKEADRFGITREDLNDAVRAMSFGVPVTEVRKTYKQIPLVLRAEGTDDFVPTLHLNELRNFPIRTVNGPYIPLSQVARVDFAQVPSRIEHEHGSRYVVVSCNVSGVKNQTVVTAIQGILSRMKFPSGYTYELTGSFTAQNETTQGLAGIGLAALLLVAAILWMEFRSIRKTFLVLLTIPLSTVGASIALWGTGQTLNVSSLIGLVMLIGVVLRNGIVLIDYIQLEIEKGMPLDEAVEEGARVRLRPILMTALSEILGLSPLALGIGSGSALERPLAIAVIGGLATSTVLTLFILPIGFRILYRKEPVRLGPDLKNS